MLTYLTFYVIIAQRPHILNPQNVVVVDKMRIGEIVYKKYIKSEWVVCSIFAL